MFKNTENSTIVVQKFDTAIIEKAIKLSKMCNVSRLIVYCNSAKECSLLDDMISESEEVSIWAKIDKTNISNEFCDYENIGVIVRTDQKSGLNSELQNVLWEMCLNIGEMPDNSYLDCLNIIWNINFKRIEWPAFDEQLNRLIDGYKTNELMIDNVLLSLDLIREHPCNVYLCDGKYCHSGHGKVPRNIYIDTNGNMHPYGIVKAELKIGNILSDSNIIEDYKQSDAIGNFMKLNRYLYLQILDKCNYGIIPWFDMLGEL